MGVMWQPFGDRRRTPPRPVPAHPPPGHDPGARRPAPRLRPWPGQAASGAGPMAASGTAPKNSSAQRRIGWMPPRADATQEVSGVGWRLFTTRPGVEQATDSSPTPITKKRRALRRRPATVRLAAKRSMRSHPTVQGRPRPERHQRRCHQGRSSLRHKGDSAQPVLLTKWPNDGDRPPVAYSVTEVGEERGHRPPEPHPRSLTVHHADRRQQLIPQRCGRSHCRRGDCLEL